MPKFFDGAGRFVTAMGRELCAGPFETVEDGGEAGGVVHDIPAIAEDDGDALGRGWVMTGDFHGLKFGFAKSARKSFSACPALGEGVDLFWNFGVIHSSWKGGFVIKNPLACGGFF